MNQQNRPISYSAQCRRLVFRSFQFELQALITFLPELVSSCPEECISPTTVAVSHFQPLLVWSAVRSEVSLRRGGKQRRMNRTEEKYDDSFRPVQWMVGFTCPPLLVSLLFSPRATFLFIKSLRAIDH